MTNHTCLSCKSVYEEGSGFNSFTMEDACPYCRRPSSRNDRYDGTASPVLVTFQVKRPSEVTYTYEICTRSQPRLGTAYLSETGLLFTIRDVYRSPQLLRDPPPEYHTYWQIKLQAEHPAYVLSPGETLTLKPRS